MSFAVNISVAISILRAGRNAAFSVQKHIVLQRAKHMELWNGPYKAEAGANGGAAVRNLSVGLLRSARDAGVAEKRFMWFGQRDQMEQRQGLRR